MSDAVLTGCLVIDGAGGKSANQSIRVRDGRIDEVGPQLSADDGETTYDCSGLTVLPGLIDMHCHLIYRDAHEFYSIELLKSIPEATVDAITNAELLLRSGFTTVRDLGSRANIGVAVKRAVNDGRVSGPAVSPAGTIISAAGGVADSYPEHVFAEHPLRDALFTTVTGPWEAVKTVRRQVSGGADWIKVALSGTGSNPRCPPERTVISPPEMDALVAEARRLNRPIAAHAESPESALLAARSGVRTIEHGIVLTDETIEAMLENNVALCPTLGNYTAFVEHGADTGCAPAVVDTHRRIHETHLDSISRAIAAGVTLIAGGDAGGIHYPQGSCLSEPALYAELLGLAPIDALATMTNSAASVLGLADQIGSIRPGLAADLLFMNQDPLEDLRSLADLRTHVAVMQAGEIVHGNLPGKESCRA